MSGDSKTDSLLSRIKRLLSKVKGKGDENMSKSPALPEAQNEVLAEEAVDPHMSASLKREENALGKEMEEISHKFAQWKAMKDSLTERQNLQEQKIKDMEEEKKRDYKVISNLDYKVITNLREEKTEEEKKWDEEKIELRKEKLALSKMSILASKSKSGVPKVDKKALSQGFLSTQQRNEDIKSEMKDNGRGHGGES